MLLSEPLYFGFGLGGQGGLLLLPRLRGLQIGLELGNQLGQPVSYGKASLMLLHRLCHLTHEGLMAVPQAANLLNVSCPIRSDLLFELLHLSFMVLRYLLRFPGTSCLLYNLLLELIPSLSPLRLISIFPIGQYWPDLLLNPFYQVNFNWFSIRLGASLHRATLGSSLIFLSEPGPMVWTLVRHHLVRRLILPRELAFGHSLSSVGQWGLSTTARFVTHLCLIRYLTKVYPVGLIGIG